MPRRPRVAYILEEYPQLSQTYVTNEIDVLKANHDLIIVAMREAHVARRDHEPYTVNRHLDALVELVGDFRPDVLHTHWLRPWNLRRTAQIAERTGVPWTVRSHSFDTLWGGWRGKLFDTFPPLGRRFMPFGLRIAAEVTRSELCLGVLAFPFVRRRLIRAGLPEHKVHACFPVVDFERFYDPSPNERGIMATGAATPKKGYDDFLQLARTLPGLRSTLYPIGFLTEELTRTNDALGAPATISPTLEPDEMPAQYKRHDWLVYTGDAKVRSVGWPVAVAEAQASGLGVCMVDFGYDLADYLGPSGFTFRTLDEARRIVSQPLDPDLRTQGFAQARRSDIREHQQQLLDLWQPALSTTRA